MNATLSHVQKKPYQRAKKSALLRARCTDSLHDRVMRVSALTDKDASDFIRDAVTAKLADFEARMHVA